MLEINKSIWKLCIYTIHNLVFVLKGTRSTTCLKWIFTSCTSLNQIHNSHFEINITSALYMGNTTFLASKRQLVHQLPMINFVKSGPWWSTVFLPYPLYMIYPVAIKYSHLEINRNTAHFKWNNNQSINIISNHLL